LNWCIKSPKTLNAPIQSKKQAQIDAPPVLACGLSLKILVLTTVQRIQMEAFFVSTGIVALAEMGDKTQLLSLVLAARFRKPWPIVLGILVATLANHGLAGAVGSWVTTMVGPTALRWVLGASFLAMAVWMLIPDKFDDEEGDSAPRMGVFLTTVVAFFLAEMGDKTQIATVMLAAQYNAWFAVVAGTTLGMMLANAPVVWLGDAITKRVPLRMVHIVSAVIFATLGLIALSGWGS
jgi:putative Ca2+/H+ antiporter (TMEM165/GDT1 family)